MEQHEFRQLGQFDPYGSYILDYLLFAQERVVKNSRQNALAQAGKAVELAIEQAKPADQIIGAAKLYEAIRQVCDMPDQPLWSAIKQVTLNIAPAIATNVVPSPSSSEPVRTRPSQPLERGITFLPPSPSISSRSFT